MAVLVPLGSLSVSILPGELRTMAVATIAIRPTNKSPANNVLKRARFSSEIRKFTLLALLIGTMPGSVVELAVLLT
jgi:hypothetical protein